MSDPGFVCKKCGVPSDNRGYDSCMVKLIDALNGVGIRTVEHCCGHGKEKASLAIDMKSIKGVLIYTTESGNSLLWIDWELKHVKPTNKDTKNKE